MSITSEWIIHRAGAVTVHWKLQWRINITTCVGYETSMFLKAVWKCRYNEVPKTTSILYNLKSIIVVSSVHIDYEWLSSPSAELTRGRHERSVWQVAWLSRAALMSAEMSSVGIFNELSRSDIWRSSGPRRWLVRTPRRDSSERPLRLSDITPLHHHTLSTDVYNSNFHFRLLLVYSFYCCRMICRIIALCQITIFIHAFFIVHHFIYFLLAM